MRFGDCKSPMSSEDTISPLPLFYKERTLILTFPHYHSDLSDKPTNQLKSSYSEISSLVSVVFSSILILSTINTSQHISVLRYFYVTNFCCCTMTNIKIVYIKFTIQTVKHIRFKTFKYKSK